MNPIILDSDPGIDDAVALLVLHHFCPERVRLLVASYGNIALEHTVNNALTMLELMDWQLPVVKGAGSPGCEAARARFENASHIHGADGLAGLGKQFPAGTAYEGDFLQRIYEEICACGTVDYITIGPLTNLALLLRRFPDVKEHIGQVVTMGGGIGKGNVTPFAEFNIHCDPYSAEIVFQEMPRIVLVPLNTTETVAFSLEEIERIAAAKTPLAETLRQILTSNYRACVSYGEIGSTMHDSTAVLYELFPEYFETKRCGIAIDCGEHYGQTTELTERENVTVTGKADSARLLERIAESAC